MNPEDPPVVGKINDPMMPVAWTDTYTGVSGRSSRVFVTTMGSADDFENDAYRRLLVNATYWAVGLENKIPSKSNVDLIGDYHPRSFLDGSYTKGIKPQELAR